MAIAEQRIFPLLISHHPKHACRHSIITHIFSSQRSQFFLLHHPSFAFAGWLAGSWMGIVCTVQGHLVTTSLSPCHLVTCSPPERLFLFSLRASPQSQTDKLADVLALKTPPIPPIITSTPWPILNTQPPAPIPLPPISCSSSNNNTNNKNNLDPDDRSNGHGIQTRYYQKQDPGGSLNSQFRPFASLVIGAFILLFTSSHAPNPHTQNPPIYHRDTPQGKGEPNVVRIIPLSKLLSPYQLRIYMPSASPRYLRFGSPSGYEQHQHVLPSSP